MNDVVIDMRHLAAFGKRLKAEAPILEKEFHAALIAAGELVAVEARQRANAFPRQYGGTNRIANSIRVRRRATGVKIQAGGPDAPEATPIEHGGLGGKFRHPVFGNTEVWRPQQSFPYLTGALTEKLPETLAAVELAVDVALAQLAI